MESKFGKKMKGGLGKKLSKKKGDKQYEANKRRFNIFGETQNFLLQNKFSCCLYFFGIIICSQYFLILSYTTLVSRSFDDTSSTVMKID